MLPRTLHLLLPHSPDKPVLDFSCHRYWTLKKYPTLELPLSTLGGYGPAFLFPLAHLPLFQFWVTYFFSSPGSPFITDQLNIFPNMKLMLLYSNFSPHYEGLIMSSTSNFITFLPWRLYCGQQSRDSNDCMSNKSLTEDQRCRDSWAPYMDLKDDSNQTAEEYNTIERGAIQRKRRLVWWRKQTREYSISWYTSQCYWTAWEKPLGLWKSPLSNLQTEHGEMSHL